MSEHRMRRFVELIAGAVAIAAILANSGGQALASHLHCGDVITQDTTLDSDLLCTRDGITIGADDITLDLGSHTVVSGRRLENVGHSGVTIENGQVSGVLLAGASRNILRELVMPSDVDNQSPLVLSSHSDRNRIENSYIASGYSPAVSVSDSDRNELENNEVRNARAFYPSGILLSRANKNLIANNEVHGFNFAIGLRNSRGNRVEDNRVFAQYSAITLTGADHNSVERNFVGTDDQLGCGGICLEHSDHNLIADNSGFSCVGIRDSSHNRLRGSC